MPVPPSVNGSVVTSSSLFDLNLPVVREGEGPTPAPVPSYEAMLAHARFLLRSDRRRSEPSRPNPEVFVLH